VTDKISVVFHIWLSASDSNFLNDFCHCFFVFYFSHLVQFGTVQLCSKCLASCVGFQEVKLNSFENASYYFSYTIKKQTS